MWIVGAGLMVLLCLGGLIGVGEFSMHKMHKQEVKQDAGQQVIKDEQKHSHDDGTSAVASEDKITGAHQHKMQGDQKHDHGDGSSSGAAVENRGGSGDKEALPSVGDGQDGQGDRVHEKP
ncbi:MAG: hypothetical protein Q7J12_00610 [Syntrophales bacterium]|nr:hypothetical protein [Syntrophales bacterium]